jgi:hypothetical protein
VTLVSIDRTAPWLASPRVRRLAVVVVALVAASAAALAFLAFVLLRALEPGPREWSTRVGPTQREVSVPVLLRWASHPLALPLLDGQRLRTKAGTWHVATRGDALRATCSPCVLRLAELGPAPLVVDRVVVDARRAGPEAWAGTVALGRGTPALAAVAWQAKLDRQGLAWRARLEPTPVATLLATLGDAVPEARRARIDGRFAFDASARVDATGLVGLEVRPRLEGLVVEGLGTDVLAGARAPARCRPTRERIDGWLPRAVIAAEDQRFFEHAGFDLDEALHAWTRNRDRADAPPRGASTITQQLAKLAFVGDDRSAVRKLREWLYAVEMERTLGKGRILQLYLALAPWGANVCGAEAASRRWLGKGAAKLEPHEAAWLASLLASPDAQLARWQARGEIDHDRVARVIDAYRPMPRRLRERHVDASMAWQPHAVHQPATANSPSE